MIEHEGGSIFVNGKELYSNLTEIRNSIGLCN